MTSSIPAETPEQKARVAKLQQMTPDKNAPLAVFLGVGRGGRRSRGRCSRRGITRFFS